MRSLKSLKFKNLFYVYCYKLRDNITGDILNIGYF